MFLKINGANVPIVAVNILAAIEKPQSALIGLTKATSNETRCNTTNSSNKNPN